MILNKDLRENACRSAPKGVMRGESVNKIKGFGRIYQKPFVEAEFH